MISKLIFVILCVQVCAAVDELDCEEPHHKHYCVLKGHIAKELPPEEHPLIIYLDLGVSVCYYLKNVFIQFSLRGQSYKTYKIGLTLTELRG